MADALARDAEFLAHLFKRVGVPIHKPEAKLQNTHFARGQGFKDFVDDLPEHGLGCRIGRAFGFVVLDEIAQVAVFFLADRHLQRKGPLRYANDLLHLTRRHPQAVGDLLGRRISAQFLHELPAGAGQPVDLFVHMHGNPDGAPLVRDRPCYGLSNPPRRIGAELIASPVIEFLHGANQANVAFLDQIQEGHTPAHVLFGDADDETRVGLDEMLLCCLAIPHGEQ